MKRLPRRSKIRPRTGARQVFVVVAAGATLALATLAIDEYMTAAKHAAATGGAGSAGKAGRAGVAVTVTVADTRQGDDDIYTGSILYMPNDGRLCRQWLFDNQNGQITDNGYVDCAQAAYDGLDGPKHWSAARMRVIATGFRGD